MHRHDCRCPFSLVAMRSHTEICMPVYAFVHMLRPCRPMQGNTRAHIIPKHPQYTPQILAKAEFMNPGGSIKDRVALEIMREAFADGRLRRGGEYAWDYLP
jgi:hypothetical protein